MNSAADILTAVVVILPSALVLIGCTLAALTREGDR